MEDGESQGPMARLHKMTRSLSFKFTGNPKEHVSRTVSKPPRPQKLDTDNWIKAKTFLRSSHTKEVPPDNIRLFNNVGDKKSLWSKKVDSHKEKQATNPFSDSFDKEKLKNMLSSKDDPNYGRPEKNSLSAMRAAAGEAKMRGDICEVCDVVFNHGQRTDDGLAAIQFGQLFSIYNRINDKLVGLLIRARKRDLLAFDGEMLYQGRDNEKWVVLTKNINTIHVYFGRDGNVATGGEVDPNVQSTSLFGSNYGSRGDSRRTSCVSVSSLPADMPHTSTNTALLLGSAALAVASIEKCPDVKFDPCPGGSKNASTNTLLETLETSSTCNLAPPEVAKSKFTAKGIRSSFRKLVRPLVRKRDTVQSDDTLEDDDLPSLSRRGSRLSHKSDSVASIHTVEGNEARHGVEARWKKVLGVSLAIGRMASMSKHSSHSNLVAKDGQSDHLQLGRKESAPSLLH